MTYPSLPRSQTKNYFQDVPQHVSKLLLNLAFLKIQISSAQFLLITYLFLFVHVTVNRLIEPIYSYAVQQAKRHSILHRTRFLWCSSWVEHFQNIPLEFCFVLAKSSSNPKSGRNKNAILFVPQGGAREWVHQRTVAEQPIRWWRTSRNACDQSKVLLNYICDELRQSS